MFKTAQEVVQELLEMGFNYETIGRYAGLHKTTIYRVANGELSPSEKTAMAIHSARVAMLEKTLELASEMAG